VWQNLAINPYGRKGWFREGEMVNPPKPGRGIVMGAENSV
jgi:hypothetical protein